MYHTRLTVLCPPAYTEILMAEIAEAGFDTFMEIEQGFEAYAEKDNYDAAALQQIKEKYSSINIEYQFDKVEQQNWNEQWERSYEPINVEDKCLIRASFHRPEKQFPFEIIITPKMSFGTGHHQTTYLMIQSQMEMDHQGKRVMDAGCGTAILSIMASKLGAKKIEAFDIDEWSVINGKENSEVNQCNNIRIQQGKIRELTFAGGFDIILANINKNILLDEMPVYRQYLASQGMLLLSGFYAQDIPDLLKEAGKYKLREVTRKEKDSWSALLLVNQ